MAKLIVGIGLPGAGKSTILKKFSENYGYEFISADDVREKLGLTAEEPSTSHVWEIVWSRTIASYKKGKTVVVDGTFLSDARIHLMNFAHENGIQKIQGLFVDTPEEIAWERNLTRDRKTSRDFFEERLRHLKESRPDITDGFDSFFTVNEDGQLTGAQISNEKKREFKTQKHFS